MSYVGPTLASSGWGGGRGRGRAGPGLGMPVIWDAGVLGSHLTVVGLELEPLRRRERGLAGAVSHRARVHKRLVVVPGK